MINKKRLHVRADQWGLVDNGNCDDWSEFDIIEGGGANTGSQLAAVTVEW